MDPPRVNMAAADPRTAVGPSLSPATRAVRPKIAPEPPRKDLQVQQIHGLPGELGASIRILRAFPTRCGCNQTSGLLAPRSGSGSGNPAVMNDCSPFCTRLHGQEITDSPKRISDAVDRLERPKSRERIVQPVRDEGCDALLVQLRRQLPAPGMFQASRSMLDDHRGHLAARLVALRGKVEMRRQKPGQMTCPTTCPCRWRTTGVSPLSSV